MNLNLHLDIFNYGYPSKTGHGAGYLSALEMCYKSRGGSRISRLGGANLRHGVFWQKRKNWARWGGGGGGGETSVCRSTTIKKIPG